MVASFWPLCGPGPFTPTTNPLLNGGPSQNAWPVVYALQTSLWSYPANTQNDGFHPATTGSSVTDWSPANSGFLNLFAGGVIGAGGFNDFQGTTVTNSGTQFASPYDPPDSVVSTPTTISGSWTILNNDRSIAGYATFSSVLSNPLTYDSAAASCLSLLNSTPLPIGDDVCQYVYPGPSGTVSVLKHGADCPVLLAAKAMPMVCSVNTYGQGYGTGLAGFTVPVTSLSQGASIDNFPWPGCGPGFPYMGAVMYVKSQWNLLPIPPSVSGLVPPTDSNAAALYKPTAYAQSLGNNTPFQNPIVAAYSLAWTLSTGGFTIGTPVLFQSLSLPASLTFNPSDVPGPYGEIGLRNAIQ
jgi:hypothetical protein